MANTLRLVGWTAIGAAERAGLTLSKATAPTEEAREGLSVEEARAVAAEDPALVYVEVPAHSGRVDVGGGKAWLEHPEHGWIEMSARCDAERVTEEDLVHDSQLRRLSDREVRDIRAPEPAVEVTSVYIQAAVAALDAGEVSAAAGAVDVAARELGDEHPEVQVMRERVSAAAGGRTLDTGVFRAYQHRTWGSDPVCIDAPGHSAPALLSEVRDISTGDDAIDALRAELDRLGANDDSAGIEVEAHPAGAMVYDTQERAVYAPAEALAALRALPDGAGVDEAWQALVRLREVS